jgi:Fe(3+) dicitrate transport protein
VYLSGTTATLPGVNVIINNGSHHGVSNGEGSYLISNLPKGKHYIKATAIGFRSKIDSFIIDAEAERLNIYLTEEFIDLPIVEINANSSTGGMLGSMSLPGSSHYISKAELKELNTQNPHAILERIPGVQVQEEDGFGLRPNIGLRGSGSERSSKITIMEDGILSAPAPYSAPSAYYFPTIARMQAVEVRKGSSQIAYGPYTTGGVINFISTPLPNELSGMVKATGGSFGTRSVHARLGDKINAFSYGVELFQAKADGFKSIDFIESDTGFDKRDYLAKVKWTSSEQSSVYQSFQVKIGEATETSNETYLGLSLNDFISSPYRRYAGSQKDEMNTNQRQLSLHYLVSPVKNLFVQASAYRNSFGRNWYKLDKVISLSGEGGNISSILNDPGQHAELYNVIKGASDEGSLFVKANNRTYKSEGIQSKINYYHSDNQNLEIGWRFHRDEMDRFQWVDEYQIDEGVMELIQAGQKGTESNRIESAVAVAGYFNYGLSFRKWQFNAGARYENIVLERSDYGKEDPSREGTNLVYRKNNVDALLPGLGIQYQLDQEQEIFGGIHRGFAPPGSKSETLPESSINYELGYRIQKPVFFFSLVSYFNDYSNLLGSDFASSGGLGSGDQFNGGEAAAYGIEMALSYRKQISNQYWIPVQFQYTYTNAEFRNSFESSFEPWGQVEVGDKLPYIAHHTFNISSGVKSNRFGIQFNGTYTGAMRTAAGTGVISTDELIESRLILSTNILYQISQHTDVSLGIHNLTDKKYAVSTRPAGWRPGAPRNISFGIEARF